MDASEILKLLVAFTGGGLLAAALGWVRVERSENRARAHELAKLRLENLYGPLYFLTEQNSRLIGHVLSLQKATKTELVAVDWVADERTMSAVNNDIARATCIANGHASSVKKNNTLICDLLSRQYSYIHVEDSERFQRFLLDHSRMELEFPEDPALKIPFQVYRKLAMSRILHPEMNDLVRSRVMELQKVISNG